MCYAVCLYLQKPCRYQVENKGVRGEKMNGSQEVFQKDHRVWESKSKKKNSKIFQLFFSHSKFIFVKDERKRYSTSSSSGSAVFARICLLFVSQKSKKLERHQHRLISHCQNFDFFDEKKNFFTHFFNISQLYHVSTSHKEVAKQDRTVLYTKNKTFPAVLVSDGWIT